MEQISNDTGDLVGTLNLGRKRPTGAILTLAADVNPQRP